MPKPRSGKPLTHGKPGGEVYPGRVGGNHEDPWGGGGGVPSGLGWGLFGVEGMGNGTENERD